MEEWISLNEYARRYKKGVSTVKEMIFKGELEATQKESGHYLIKVGGDTVPRQQYEKLYERCIQAETKLANISNIVGG